MDKIKAWFKKYFDWLLAAGGILLWFLGFFTGRGGPDRRGMGKDSGADSADNGGEQAAKTARDELARRAQDDEAAARGVSEGLGESIGRSQDTVESLGGSIGRSEDAVEELNRIVQEINNRNGNNGN